MNQILYNCMLKNNNSISRKKFIIIFFISVFLMTLGILVYLFNKYKINKNENFSKNLVSNYNILTLYSDSNNNYITEHLIEETKSDPFIIGLIQIDKINLIYPILSTTNKELLKISPCRFSGPMPNQIGNLCIAGHNYVDNKLFSKLDYLENDDIIKIFDLSGNSNDYIIYDKKEIKSDDVSCIEQENINQREITLITCNNINGNRICIKAIENK